MEKRSILNTIEEVLAAVIAVALLMIIALTLRGETENRLYMYLLGVAKITTALVGFMISVFYTHLSNKWRFCLFVLGVALYHLGWFFVLSSFRLFS